MSDSITEATTVDGAEVPNEPSPDAGDTLTGADTEPAAADTADDADNGDIGKARKEAAKYRARLRETETERDQLRAQLGGQRRALVDWRAAGNSVDPALLDAAGINLDDLLDDTGHLSMAAVDEFIDATATRFRVARGLAPNRAQGSSGHGPVPEKPSLANAFKPK